MNYEPRQANHQRLIVNACFQRFWGRVRRGFVHAFALRGQPHQLTSDEMALLDRFARLLADRGLVAPAIFLVESLAPLSFIGAQLAHALAPIMEIVAPPDDVERLARLLERRETPFVFIDRLRCEEEACRK